MRKTTATPASETVVLPSPKARTEAKRHITKQAVSSSMPPMPVSSFCGRWSTSSMRGTTPAKSDRTRVTMNFRRNGTAVTTSTSTATVRRPAITVREGVRDGVFSVPVT